MSDLDKEYWVRNYIIDWIAKNTKFRVQELKLTETFTTPVEPSYETDSKKKPKVYIEAAENMTKDGVNAIRKICETESESIETTDKYPRGKE